MLQTFSTNKSNWQGVDDNPTVGSDNLIKSGGIITSIFAKTGNIVWERGNMKAENGKIVYFDQTKNNRIRTAENAYIHLIQGTKINCASSYQFFVYKIDEKGNILSATSSTIISKKER